MRFPFICHQNFTHRCVSLIPSQTFEGFRKNIEQSRSNYIMIKAVIKEVRKNAYWLGRHIWITKSLVVKHKSDEGPGILCSFFIDAGWAT
jgi:hypothetical protein